MGDMRVRTTALALALAFCDPFAPRWATAQLPVFRSGVELIDVAVVVRDIDGRFVETLTAGDFRVIEGGVPQTIAAFDRVSIPIVTMRPAPASTAVPSDVGTNERANEGRIFVLVLDALHVSPAAEAYVPASVGISTAVTADVHAADGRGVLQRREKVMRRPLAETSFPIDTGAMDPGDDVLRIALSDVRPSRDTERRVAFPVVANPTR